MLKYGKLNNKETKQCIVFEGEVTEENKAIIDLMCLELIDVEKSFNGCWYLKGYEVQQNLEDLKQRKYIELKYKRDAYKRIVSIKGTITLSDLEPYTYNYANLIGLKYGWTQDDLNKFNQEIDRLVKKYDYYKNKISEAQSAAELNSINIEF